MAYLTTGPNNQSALEKKLEGSIFACSHENSSDKFTVINVTINLLKFVQ